MATGQAFTVVTQFGGGGTPTYNGQTVTAPPANGNVAINPQSYVPHGNSDVIIYGETIIASKVTGFGALVKTINLNSNANTPSATVKFKQAATGNTDLSFALSAGQAVAFSSAAAGGWINNTNTTTSISVTPDTVSDMEVDIVVIVNS